VQPERGLSRSDMVADGPDDYDRRDQIKEGEQQAAIEGWRGPQWRRFAQAKGVRKQGQVRHVRVAEEVIDGNEEAIQSERIFVPIAVMVVALARSDQRGARSERTEIVQDGEAKGSNSDQDENADQRNQRRAERGPHIEPEIVPKRSENCAKNRGKYRSAQCIQRPYVQIRPTTQWNRRRPAARPRRNYSAILPTLKNACFEGWAVIPAERSESRNP
jgi:hypothetical protein